MNRVATLAATLIAATAILANSVHADDMPVPAPPQLDAKSYFLMDYASGEVLAESAATEQYDPASVTKLMTAYVVFKALAEKRIALDDQVYVSERAWRTPGSRMFIEVDTQVPVEKLISGMIIQSGNDASVALAEHVAGSVESFVELMNHYAESLGMTSTHYANPTGLTSKGHVSSARDSALLARAIIAEFPEFYGLYSEKQFTYNEITQHNRNALLWRDESVDGLKTGYTSSAGYCLVSSAERGGMRLIAVVMGMPSAAERASGSQALLNYGFRFYETHRLYARGETVTEAKVRKGGSKTVALGLDEDVYVTVPRGKYGELKATMEVDEELVAPIVEQQGLGEIRVALGDEDISVLPLVSLNAVPEAGILARIADSIMLWFD